MRRERVLDTSLESLLFSMYRSWRVVDAIGLGWLRSTLGVAVCRLTPLLVALAVLWSPSNTTTQHYNINTHHISPPCVCAIGRNNPTFLGSFACFSFLCFAGPKNPKEAATAPRNKAALTK